jgi:predicted nucleic acid-binding protein
VTELVLDSSAYVQVVGSKRPEHTDLRSRITAAACHAPHLLDAEVGHVLRRRVLAGALDAEVARQGLRTLRVFVTHRYEQTGALAEAAWELRGAITFYDALYVALAAALDVPLLTADARLTRAPGLPCQVELVA